MIEWTSCSLKKVQHDKPRETSHQIENYVFLNPPQQAELKRKIELQILTVIMSVLQNNASGVSDVNSETTCQHKNTKR